MSKIKQFINKIIKDTFGGKKDELKDRLTDSLQEKVDDLVEQGMSEEEATEKAIREFGDAEDVLEAFPTEAQKKKKIIAKRRAELFFSLVSYLLIVGLSIFINLTFYEFFGEFNWFVIVIFGVFFWPLTMLYRYLNARK